MANPLDSPEYARTHRTFTRFHRVLAGTVLHIFRHSYDHPAKLPEQFLLISNHQTDFDPIILGAALPPMPPRYLCGEQLMRTRGLGPFLHWFIDPIPTVRHIADMKAIKRAVAAVKRGESVVLYPAGQHEWDGAPMPQDEGVGKLAKMLKVPLITYRLDGLYFMRPRWAKNRRIIPTSGRMVGIYQPEELASMSAQEVTDLINRDLHGDSDAWRVEIDRPTKGKQLAEWLEKLLFICPVCGQMHTLRSHDDHLSCECGLEVVYTNRDVFAMPDGSKPPFATVRAWNEWQQQRFAELFAESEGGLVLEDEGVEVHSVVFGESATPVCSGTVRLDAEAISCGEWRCTLDEIRGLDTLAKKRLIVSTKTEHFELRGHERINFMKYVLLYNLLKAPSAV